MTSILLPIAVTDPAMPLMVSELMGTAQPVDIASIDQPAPAPVILIQEIPAALPIEALRGPAGPSGLEAETSTDLAGWYRLQKEL
jgi:hypothetical protein